MLSDTRLTAELTYLSPMIGIDQLHGAVMASRTLKAFHSAQTNGNPTAYDRALAELRAGRKRSHWIWFVLPQLRSLGRSAMAQRYGLADLEEAQAYLADPLCASATRRSWP